MMEPRKWIVSRGEKPERVVCSGPIPARDEQTVHVIEKSALVEITKDLERSENRRFELLESANKWAARAAEAERAYDELEAKYNFMVDSAQQNAKERDELRAALEMIASGTTGTEPPFRHVSTMELRRIAREDCNDG